MTNPSKQRGTAAETAVVNYLRSLGYTAERRTLQGGGNDKGDIFVAELPHLVFEVKNTKRIEWAAYTDELLTEMRNAGATGGVLIVKRRGTTDVSRWFWLCVGDARPL